MSNNKYRSKLTLSGSKSSPKTPILNKRSKQQIYCPDSESPSSTDTQFSTPIARRNRESFFDDSPLHSNFSASPSYDIPLTQETANSVDVVWGWNRNASPIIKKKIIPRRNSHKRILKPKYEENINLSPKIKPIKGFHKFQLELEKISKQPKENLIKTENLSEPQEIQNSIIDTPIKNVLFKIEPDSPEKDIFDNSTIFNKTEMKKEDSKSPDYFSLQQSNCDNITFKTSTSSPPKLNNSTFSEDDFFASNKELDEIFKQIDETQIKNKPLQQFKTENIEEDSSFDDYLSTSALDIIIKQSTRDQSSASILKKSNSSSSLRKSISRQNSMPHAQQNSSSGYCSNDNPIQPKGQFTRNKSCISFNESNSMADGYRPNVGIPVNTLVTKRSPISPSSTSTSSSISTSSSSSSDKCSRDEIEQKRLAAFRRLQASRQNSQKCNR